MTQNHTGKKLIQNGLFGFFFLFILVFAFYGSKHIIFGIQIKNVNLVDGVMYQEGVIDITGNAKNAIKLYINGREITREKDGKFNENLALIEGYNQITIEARDKFQNKDKKIYSVIYKPKERLVAKSESKINEEVENNETEKAKLTKDTNIEEIKSINQHTTEQVILTEERQEEYKEIENNYQITNSSLNSLSNEEELEQNIYEEEN